MLAHEIDRLLDAAAFRHDVLRHEHAFAFMEGEAAAKHEIRFVVLFRENGLHAQRAADFLSDDDAADRGADDRLDRHVLEGFRQRRAELRRDQRVLQKQRRLEVAVAMQSAAEQKMTMQQRAGLFEVFDDFTLFHESLPCDLSVVLFFVVIWISAITLCVGVLTPRPLPPSTTLPQSDNIILNLFISIK